MADSTNEGRCPKMRSELIYVVSADVSVGMEDDFNTWYDEVHVPEVLGCPGYLSATRYEATEGQPRYLAIYEIQSEDALTSPEMQEVWGWGPLTPHVKNFHGRIYRRTRSALAPLAK